ncbi:MAG: tetratricopeptide repeat protein [bacterium]|nr:tetratricopeptide repeat protein [bacterium]
MRNTASFLSPLLVLLTGCFLFDTGGGSHPSTTPETAVTATETSETSDLAEHIDAGNALLAAGDLSGATREYEKAQQIAPDDPFVNNNLGLVYMESELFSLAVSYFEKAIEILPYYYKAYNNLGNAYQELSYYDLSREAYEEALKIKPDYALAHWNLALLLEKTGDALDAIRHWQRYISLSEGEGDIAFARNRIAALRDSTSSTEGVDAITEEEAGYSVE